MSRLYNTLEKIRAATQVGATFSRPLPSLSVAPPKSTKSLLALTVAGCLVVGASAALGLYFSKNGLKGFAIQLSSPRQQVVQPGAPATSSPVAAPNPTPPPTENREKQYVRLNEAGFAMLRNGQHWPAIHSLEQARRLAPERPEAVINMAVALAELGLRVPAQRLFKEALEMSPNHPVLHRNLEILANAGFLDDQPLMASMSEPQARPAETNETPNEK